MLWQGDESIPKEQFVFVGQRDTLQASRPKFTSRGYFADVLFRFQSNKSSVVAACIIVFLILYAILAPMLSPYSVEDKDSVYSAFPPFIRSIADKGLGFWDGGVTFTSQNERQLQQLRAIGMETGKDPVISIQDTWTEEEIYRGRPREISYYKLRINQYYKVGIRYQNLSYDEFERIQNWQDQTGIQVIYPYVASESIHGLLDANIWYQALDDRGTPKLNANGGYIPAYSRDTAASGAAYHSLRITGDDGTYVYSRAKSGSVQCRVEYYAYYQYLHGMEPTFAFGTNSMGQDLFSAIGTGARFSLVFAVIVSAINLTLGAIYGAIQGYYGGAIDMTMDRIAEVLANVPFIVVATLFQLHLASRVGTVVSFLFAFVLTGWISMAALTRKQFYRFKGQEYVLAARTLGASDRRLMFKHILPNSLGTLVTSCVLVIPSVISSEAMLTYLNIVDLSEFAGTSIGALIAQGQTSLTTAPHAMLFPALFVSLLLISFNLFGNGLRDAFNPSTRGIGDL